MVISPTVQVLLKAVVAAAAGMVVTTATLVQGLSHQRAAISQHNSTGSVIPCCLHCSIAYCCDTVLPDRAIVALDTGHCLPSGIFVYMLFHD